MSLRFTDISHWQSGIDLPAVVDAGGLGAVVVKATEGIGWVDECCDRFVQQLLEMKIPFGYYHFARSNDPAEEAEYFHASTVNYEGHGIPILDWEAGQTIDWVNEFVERFHELSSVWPWVYSNARLFNQGTVNLNCGRWIAGYPKGGIITDISYGQTNRMPYKVNNGLVCAWQFSSSVQIAGFSGNIDGNVFYGDAEQWNAYANPTGGTIPEGIAEGDVLTVTEISDDRIVLEKN